MNKKVFLVVSMWCALIFAQDFVIGAYGTDSISLFSNARDSLRLNTVLYGRSVDYSDVMDALSAAENETLKVILSSAPPLGGRRLNWYTDLWHRLCQAYGVRPGN
jgi:hypothetical protein